MSTSCDSCGAVETQFYAVRRKYVTPETWDTPGSERVLPEIEHWCYACSTHYPHEPVSE